MPSTDKIDDPFEQPNPPSHGFALFNYGFRPFFFFASLFAAGSILIWVGMYAGHVTLNLTSPPMLWHAHEMLFGYTAATIAGFFLTVIPNWTKAKAQKGPVLMVLTLFWLLGRFAVWGQGSLPYELVAGLDMIFLIALTAVVVKPLFNPQYRRQFMFVPILLCLIAGNLMTHLSVLGLYNGAEQGITLAIDAILVLIAIMGGRVTPSFTSSFLGHANPDVKVVQDPRLDRAVLVASWVVLTVDQVAAGSMFSGFAFVIASTLHLARLLGWQGWRTFSNPLLWALHLGYLWLVIGMAFKGLADFGLVDPAAALHTLTIGAIGTMTLAIMSRASLGHTGRALKAHPMVVVAYALVSGAAIARLSVSWWPDATLPLIMASGVMWATAFLLFFMVYAPILWRPRLDGRPG